MNYQLSFMWSGPGFEPPTTEVGARDGGPECLNNYTIKSPHREGGGGVKLFQCHVPKAAMPHTVQVKLRSDVSHRFLIQAAKKKIHLNVMTFISPFQFIPDLSLTQTVRFC